MTRRGTILAAGVLLASALVGCTPAVSDEITLVVYQPRTDIAQDRLAIQVHNGTGVPLEVTAARLSSPDFAADPTWPGDSAIVPAGRALDLRAALPEVLCDAETRPVATIEYVDGDATRVAELAVDDPYELLPRLHREACLAEQIDAIATIEPREVILPEGRAPAILVLGIEPTGASGSVTLDSVGGTTLLLPSSGDQGSDSVELGVTIDADGPLEVRIPLVPNRCDPHALMEDKVGTIIPLYVTTATDTGSRWMLPVTDEQRADLYGYVAAYCGLPAG